jgi:hypothetical protein
MRGKGTWKAEGSGEHATPTRTNPPGSNKGFGFLGGMNALKRRCVADEVMQKSARANRGDGNVVSTTEGEVKALKGETHERWGLKEASKGGETESAGRVAKP